MIELLLSDFYCLGPRQSPFTGRISVKPGRRGPSAFQARNSWRAALEPPRGFPPPPRAASGVLCRDRGSVSTHTASAPDAYGRAHAGGGDRHAPPVQGCGENSTPNDSLGPLHWRLGGSKVRGW